MKSSQRRGITLSDLLVYLVIVIVLSTAAWSAVASLTSGSDRPAEASSSSRDHALTADPPQRLNQIPARPPR